MYIKCKISIGEYLDKLSILYIKRIKITDPSKLINVNKEIRELEKTLKLIPEEPRELMMSDLMKINEKMWNCNEKRKLKIEECEFDQEYLKLSIEESAENDRRFHIKQKINQFFDSEIKEEKSYGRIKSLD